MHYDCYSKQTDIDTALLHAAIIVSLTQVSVARGYICHTHFGSSKGEGEHWITAAQHRVAHRLVVLGLYSPQ
jgi:hypothetical protein